MAPRILFLDDNPERHKRVKSKLLHDEAYNVEELKGFLVKKKYDCIFLDHDLFGKEYCDSSKEITGVDAAKYIVAEKIEVKLIVVHSNNPGGAANIASILRKAEYEVLVVPFTGLSLVLDIILERIGEEDGSSREDEAVRETGIPAEDSRS